MPQSHTHTSTGCPIYTACTIHYDEERFNEVKIIYINVT